MSDQHPPTADRPSPTRPSPSGRSPSGRSPSGRLKTGLLWGLGAANLALAASLVTHFAGENAAVAQSAEPRPAVATPTADEFARTYAQQAAGGRGEYLMIPGRAIGAPVDVVYVIDTVNGIMGGIAPDNNNRLSGMPPVNLRQVFDNFQQRGRPDNDRR